jgi:NTF2 fold immunity protein
MDNLRLKFMLCLIVFLAMLLGAGREVGKTARGYVPPNGFVPTAETAIAVAEAVLAPVYGKDQIDSEHPFKAILNGDVWTVKGSVPCHNPPPGAECPGGAAEIRISKRTGQVLFMTHYE